MEKLACIEQNHNSNTRTSINVVELVFCYFTLTKKIFRYRIRITNGTKFSELDSILFIPEVEERLIAIPKDSLLIGERKRI